MRVESIVDDHAGCAEVAGELAVEAVEDGALRHNLRGLSANILGARLVNDVTVVLDNICVQKRFNKSKFHNSYYRWQMVRKGSSAGERVHSNSLMSSPQDDLHI